MSNSFSNVAQVLNLLTIQDGAEIRYDMLSDALYWSDEIPRDSGDNFDFACLQPVFRYRMTLMLGDPDVEFQTAWEIARGMFPKWPGFCTGRCSQNADLTALYREYHKKAVDALRLLPD
ncbi:hypothetical protein LOC68_10885 [Blastopirellula sp. JC732]|uniref:Uncharacterized protein n=1 Tax=Blastopirellula sediminis TaxID=2894196 RepID=A0A9X1MME8_9BACT|nr:hypothetical protein [Blastopirellula sediminis]MCC9608318.1 hypothetical protein [Blastopirellula sediminis]MCC9628905.1 hypothetical protein [Blastopirellula sediminis]